MLEAWLIRWAGRRVAALVTGRERGSLWVLCVGDAVLVECVPGPAARNEAAAVCSRRTGGSNTSVELEMRLPGRRSRDLSRRNSDDSVPGCLRVCSGSGPGSGSGGQRRIDFWSHW